MSEAEVPHSAKLQKAVLYGGLTGPHSAKRYNRLRTVKKQFAVNQTTPGY
jgi:hypothetical protein